MAGDGRKLNVYQGVVVEFKHLIELGALKYGEKLPSCRAYGYERGINPNTVEKAYAELEAAGYIEILPKKGAYVRYGGEAAAYGAVKEQLLLMKGNGVTRADIERAVAEVYGKEGEK